MKMSEFVIITDSACDLHGERLSAWGVPYVPITFRFSDDGIEKTEEEMDTRAFYQKMREGGVAKTAAANASTFEEAFEPYLKEGNDLLYLGFSSGLSTTFQSANIAKNTLCERYPDRKILILDTLSASAGFGMLVYLAVEKKKSGASIDEVYDYITACVPKMCHWFTVDDLVYLKRGGRVSAAAAFVGGLLGIKPVLHMDDAGHLINMSKVRGRRASLVALLNQYTELAEAPNEGTVFISHGDCPADATLLADMLYEKHGVRVQLTTEIGPVIGAHSGPGTLALFFLGKSR